MEIGHFDARGTLASLAAPKFFFNFFLFHICDRAWFWLRVAPPTIFVAPIVAEKNVSNLHRHLSSSQILSPKSQQHVRHTSLIAAVFSGERSVGRIKRIRKGVAIIADRNPG